SAVAAAVSPAPPSVPAPSLQAGPGEFTALFAGQSAPAPASPPALAAPPSVPAPAPETQPGEFTRLSGGGGARLPAPPTNAPAVSAPAPLSAEADEFARLFGAQTAPGPAAAPSV